MAAVDAAACILDAEPSWRPLVQAAPRWHVIAAGKAAAPMLRACLAHAPCAPAAALLIAPELDPSLPAAVEQRPGGHPVPTAGSVAAGGRALEIAAAAREDEALIVLLTGGASALMAAPVAGITLADKRATTDRLLRAGADIHELNTVRKQLSRVKGGQLAAASPARVLCLAISDVVDDDPAVIGSGPTVADPSTCADALAVIDRRGGRGAYPAAVVARLERAASSGAGRPQPAPARRAETLVVGNRDRALAGARAEAERRGYDVVVKAGPITGEARAAAAAYASLLAGEAARRSGAWCLLSGGETTVHVIGGGKGGRNQEFALALVPALGALARRAAVVSLGTDGIDGPTDAAGAVVDTTTAARADASGGPGVQARLEANDAYRFFDPLGDLIRTGRTRTNVGDVQVAVVAAEDER